MPNLLKLQTLEFNAPKPARSTATIAELRSTMPASILAHYDRLRARGKKGVAAVSNQVCTACHMQLTLGVLMALKQGQGIQSCQNCGCYLYLPEEAPASVTPALPAAKPRPAVRRRNVTARV